MIGDLSRATFSNIEQQSIDHWQNTMLPWCERWEAAIEELIGDPELEVEFDIRNLMRGDSASRGIYVHNLVLDGVLTRNEARALEGYDPIEGLDEPLIPMNEAPVSAEEPAAMETPDLVEATPEASREAVIQAKLRGLVRGAAARMARRVAAGSIPAAEVLADAFAMPLAKAQAWLAGRGPRAGSVDAIAAALEAWGGFPRAGRKSEPIQVHLHPIFNVTMPAPQATRREVIRDADGLITGLVDLPAGTH
jgi:hypothetical protein